MVERVTQTQARFHVSETQLPLADIFEQLNEYVGRVNVHQWSVSQTTLEQIFLQRVHDSEKKKAKYVAPLLPPGMAARDVELQQLVIDDPKRRQNARQESLTE